MKPMVSPKEDWPVVQWAANHGFQQIQKAFEGIFQNLKVPGLSWFFSGPILWWSRLNALEGGTSDKVSHQVAQLIQQDSPQRERLTDGIYLPNDPKHPLARLDQTFKMVKQCSSIEKKIREAIKTKTLPKKRVNQLVDEAFEKRVITREEWEIFKKTAEARMEAIQVDAFSQKEFLARQG